MANAQFTVSKDISFRDVVIFAAGFCEIQEGKVLSASMIFEDVFLVNLRASYTRSALMGRARQKHQGFLSYKQVMLDGSGIIDLENSDRYAKVTFRSWIIFG